MSVSHLFVLHCEPPSVPGCCRALLFSERQQVPHSCCSPAATNKFALRVQARSMQDNIGDCTEAGPSRAVQMIGLNHVPVAGDEFIVLPSIDEVSCLCCAAHICGACRRPHAD